MDRHAFRRALRHAADAHRRLRRGHAARDTVRRDADPPAARLRCGAGTGPPRHRLRGHPRRAHGSVGATAGDAAVPRLGLDPVRRLPASRRLRAGAVPVGAQPSNCRLLDPTEAMFAGLGDGRSSILVLGFESATTPAGLDDAGARTRRGPRWPLRPGGRRALHVREGSTEHRSGAAGAWREAFLRMPYWRDPAVGLGVIMDTFETAITWDRFEDFYRNVKHDLRLAIERATGQSVELSCRFTHVYPDGPAPYFTFVTRAADGSVASALAAWREIKQAANAAVVTTAGPSPSPRGRTRPPLRIRAGSRSAVQADARCRETGRRPAGHPEPGRADRP